MLSLSQKILRNTAWNFFSRVVIVPINICLVPFIINRVGVSWYGVWVILYAFVEYFSLLDFGVGAATIKYVADYYVMGRAKKIGQAIFTACIFNMIYIPPLVTAIFLEKTILGFFNINPQDMADAVFIFRWVLLNFAMAQMAGVFRNTLIGLQLIHITNLCEIFYLLGYAAMTTVILGTGGGLKGLVVMLFILRCFQTAAHIYFVFNSIPKAEVNPGLFSVRMVKKFFLYGIKLQLNSIAGLINFQFDKLIIGHFLKLDFVAFYEVGSKLAMTIRLLPSIFLSPLIPASAELKVYQDFARLEKLYLQATKYMFLLAIPITVFLVVMGPAVMQLWLGSQSHPSAVLAVQLLALGYCFNITAGAALSIGRGIGIIKYEMQCTMMIAIMNVILSIALIVKIGFIGVLIGTSVSMMVGNGIFLLRFNRFICRPDSNPLAKLLVKPSASACIAGTLVYCVHKLIEDLVLYSIMGRIELAVYLLLLGLFFLGIFVYCLWITKCLSRADLDLVSDLFTAIRAV